MTGWLALWLWLLPAEAADRLHRSLVLGASVVVALGPVETGGRVGGGIDAAYGIQRYSYSTGTFDGVSLVWVDERPTPNYGPVLHVWRGSGAWNASLGARFSVAWPLRVGVLQGWMPGPGLGVELAPMLSTAGFVALDGQLVADAPWVQGRVGTALTTTAAPVMPRVSVGVLGPLVRPENWPDGQGSVWHPPAR